MTVASPEVRQTSLPSWVAAEPGQPCAAGERTVDVIGGRVVRTVSVRNCDDPAVWVVPLVCPHCGFKTSVPYCLRHVGLAVSGEMRCFMCPDVEVVPDA